MKNFIFLSYLILLGLVYPRVVIVSDDYSHLLGELSIHFEFLNLPISYPKTTGCETPTVGGNLVKNF